MVTHGPHVPLAEVLRPNSLSEVVGQDHLVGPEGFITRLISSGKPLSILLWGPPGSGKTTIARLLAKAFSMRFVTLSAIFSGIADLKKIIHEAEEQPLLGSSTLLFVDEIHRFNKAQQDAFLPFLERGKLILVGATAENPSFYLNNALLSRLRVLKLYALQDKDLEKLVQHYEQKRGHPLNVSPEGRQMLIDLAQGDGRYLFNMIENIEGAASAKQLEPAALTQLLQRRAALYDKGDDQHYNIISALHKSVRGSDADAALYWFARMLEGGEEPLYIARRLIRMATEDIGLADPQALLTAIAAKEAYQMLGSPEGELALAQAVVYMALAPKSNAVYTALSEARALANKSTHLDPPAIILNAPTKLMKDAGYGKGYIYDHDTPLGFSGQEYFPDGLERTAFYHPVERGFEREMRKRLEYFKNAKMQRRKETP